MERKATPPTGTQALLHVALEAAFPDRRKGCQRPLKSRALGWIQTRHVFFLFQASQMIVSYDEHEVNNTFKFGVIYQKFKQVSI